MRHSGRTVLLAIFLCVAVVPCLAGTINYVNFGLAQGGSASYNQSTGTMTWSGGGYGQIGLTDGSTINFDSGSAGVTITGNAGGAAVVNASTINMSSLSFMLTYAPYGQTGTSSIVIAGTLTSGAKYKEVKFGADLLGEATVDVQAYLSSPVVGESWQWVEPTGSSLSTTIIGIGNFANYFTQNYSSNNLEIVVSSEAVPEPATMSLLVIGAVGMLIKRKK